MKEVIKLTNIIDAHVHLRTIADKRMPLCTPHTAKFVSGMLPMPNTNPHIYTSEDARKYRQEIELVLKHFELLGTVDIFPTIYLTPQTNVNDLVAGYLAGDVFSCKQYPRGATTNSAEGVSGIKEMFPIYQVMEKYGIPLHVHCEMPMDVDVDIFDSEKFAIQEMLIPILDNFPNLKVSMEHITTKEAAELVSSGIYPNLVATVTPQHLLYDRNKMLRGGLDAHLYCMPILKRKKHMEAIRNAVKNDERGVFLCGTDSAPHFKTDKNECGCAGVYSAPVFVEAYVKAFMEMNVLEKLQAFMSDNFCKFYGYTVPEAMQKTVVVEQVEPWKVPDVYDGIVPLFHGEELNLKARLQ